MPLDVERDDWLDIVVSLFLYGFITTFLTKAECCRNIEIVLHPTALTFMYIYVYIHKYLRGRTQECSKSLVVLLSFYWINVS